MRCKGVAQKPSNGKIMTLQIDTTGQILIDGKGTGCGIRQAAQRTEIVRAGNVLDMPHARYSSTSDNPRPIHTGATDGRFQDPAGRAALEQDLRKILGL